MGRLAFGNTPECCGTHMHSDKASPPDTPADAPADPATGPVRTHQDVLTLIADVERQVARLRDVQALSVDELSRQETRLRELESREQAIHAAEAMLTARDAQLRSMAEGLRAEEGRLAARVRDVEIREHSCVECAQALERDRVVVGEERERLSADVARLEHERRSVAEVREEIARREESLQSEMARHREGMESLRTQLEAVERGRAEERARAEAQAADADTHRREVEARLAERTGELEETRQSLQLAGQKLAALAQSVAEQAPQLERGAAALALVHEQERRIRELQQRVDATLGDAERVSILERELAAAREALEVSESNVRTLDAKVHEISSAAETAKASQAERFGKQLEDKARMIAEMGHLLKKRKERLDRARVLVRERAERSRRKAREASEAAIVSTLEEERLIKRQREELRQVQEMLEASESRLMRRTARSRGMAAVIWSMLATCVVAVACWVAAGVVWPLPSVASVDLVAKLPDGMSFRPEHDAQWQALHRDALKDEAFRTGVLRRLSERGVNALGGSAELAAWLDEVRVDSDGPGTMRLIATGPDPDTATIALDTLATSLANDSAKLVKGTSDLPKATLAGNTAIPGRITFSTIVPQSSPRDRLVAAGMLFSGVAGLGLAAGLVVFGRLSRAKRTFEEIDGV